MPCGGVYPTKADMGPCWVCNKGGTDHFCDEWDTGLHGACVIPFLTMTEEGQLVWQNHKHSILIDLGEGLVIGPIGQEVA
jgi:hypothetical protein